MNYNRTTQEEMEMREAELVCALIANNTINQYEKTNLIGNKEYGKPELPEDRIEIQENIGLRKRFD